jgi:hypothetical protein
MSDSKIDSKRRNLLKGIAVMPIAMSVLHSNSVMAEDISLDDPTAKAVAYTAKSTTKGQSCSNCNFFKGGKAAKGPCLIFGGKNVVSTGWCKTWAAAPAA